MFTDLFDTQPAMRKVSPASSEAGTGLVENFESFGWLRNERDRAVMLEIRHAHGLISAYSYPLLESAEFNPSIGVTLNFAGTTVKLIGRNLNTELRPGLRLFASILQHRVPWIQVVNEANAAESAESDVVIDEVKMI